MRSSEAKERFRHARQLYADRRFQDCLDILDSLATVYSAYPDLHYLRARCLGKLKRGAELRAVAELLTNSFQDPRGAEILSWFVPAPSAEGPRDITTPAARTTLAEISTPVAEVPPNYETPAEPTLADSIEIDWGNASAPTMPEATMPAPFEPFQPEPESVPETAAKEPEQPENEEEIVDPAIDEPLRFDSIIQVIMDPPEASLEEVSGAPSEDATANDTPADAEPIWDTPVAEIARDVEPTPVADFSPTFDLPDQDSPAGYVESGGSEIGDDADAIPDAVFMTPLETPDDGPDSAFADVSFVDAVPAAPRASTAPPSPKPVRPRKRGRSLVALAIVAVIAGVAAFALVTDRFPIPGREPATFAVARTTTPAPARPSPPEPVQPDPVVSADPAPAPEIAPQELTFDLSAKRVAFIPDDSGGYALEAMPFAFVSDRGTERHSSVASRHAPVLGWKQEIPFDFAFGGVAWDTLFVNLNGNLTFGYAEADAWPEREPDGEAEVRAIAAVIDSRSAAGRERMIAPLWHPFDAATTKVYVNAAETFVAITWFVNAGTDSEGAFQAVLRDSGRIEFAYRNIAIGGAVTGIFPGITWAGEPLARIEDAEDALDPNVDIIAFTTESAPSVVQFTFTMRAVIPLTVASGELIHRVTLDTDSGPRQFGVTITNEPRGWVDWGADPRTIGYERDVNRLYLYVSKGVIADVSDVNVHAEVVWRGHDDLADRVDPLAVPLASALAHTGETDFSIAQGNFLGSVYEVFD